MSPQIKHINLAVALILVGFVSPLFCQQKGQWVPGQFGLNAGVIPEPGITYANLALNYSASRLNDSNGNRILQNVTGTYSFWVDENIFYYVPHHKILGGYFMPYIAVNYASGSVVAALPPLLPQNTSGISLSAGGSGLADTFVEPLNIGWHFAKRVDFNAGYAFTAPTGRYTAGANDNVGSGYWGNDITSGTTLYITKNHGTTANLDTAWEIHGQKSVASLVSGNLSKITPGQTFTQEWGIGQVLPVKKDMSQLAQLGLVGYDQWQVSSNGGNYTVAGLPVAASRVPYYSVHGIGLQANYILPAKDLVAFFKYYDEYSAKARPQGRTFVFGFSWTLRIPKPAPAKP
ncbi:MAG: transporter [Candidatus Sulfotelmatobacter sp.]